LLSYSPCYSPSYGAHRALPSFPTRRSSDLINIGMGCERCLSIGYLGRSAIYELLQMEDKVREQVMRHASATEIKEHAVQRGLRTDRKSTRLNSSHVAISYAVFCLKKKKETL